MPRFNCHSGGNELYKYGLCKRAMGFNQLVCDYYYFCCYYESQQSGCCGNPNAVHAANPCPFPNPNLYSFNQHHIQSKGAKY